MRFQRLLLIPVFLAALLLAAGTAHAAPTIDMFQVKITSLDGQVKNTFRIGEQVKYVMKYRYSTTSNDNPRPVAGSVKIRFAESGCTRTYEKVKADIAPDENKKITIKKRIPACSSVSQPLIVTFTLRIGKPGQEGWATEESVTSSIVAFPPLQPIARFNASPLGGEVPLTVRFTNKSLGTVDTYAWDFDNDGNVDSTEFSPKHVYSSAGTYSVKLTLKDGSGAELDSKTRTGYVTAIDPASVLAAQFMAPEQQRSVLWEGSPVTVDFEDRSSGNPDSWSWSFGDGSSSTDQHPSHSYQAPGLYTVILTVSNSSTADTETKTNYIYIYE